jgi:hypothetical protein
MRHELIDLGNGQVYVVNIPTKPSEGNLSKEDVLILNLWERLKKCMGDYPHIEPSFTPTTNKIEFKTNYLKKNNGK